ncbi:MAG: DUF302 domain-containing protein [Gammaproteobacteria bacterium]|nr:DUF302 domain-containing protein [Gammaproteobacteria bacterium]
MKKLFILLLAPLLLSLSTSAHGVVTGELIMIRSIQSFPETMASLQTAIADKGYTVSRVQRVDVGLTARGYKTDKYRIVFFAKPEEITRLKTKYPELIPYLPLKIAIFAENNETIVVSSNPMVFADFYPQPELKQVFAQWKKDVIQILKYVQFSD